MSKKVRMIGTFQNRIGQFTRPTSHRSNNDEARMTKQVRKLNRNLFVYIRLHSWLAQPLDDSFVASKLSALTLVIYEALSTFRHCCPGRIGHDRKRCDALPGKATACFIYSRGQ